ncbi:LysR family transcriptional regulator [Endozoicomonas sp. (ex Bugula neritina AB1)]|nr:LysR family transcriptional regulator [Endozoicomonas sp. (ex Bugula neritina AB1)]
MDTNSLIAFLAVVDCGSFSEAADKLFLTQPAVSKRISGLEDQLGTSLFDRTSRRVSLNEAGRTLLPRARQMLDLLSDTRQELTNLNGEIKGPLTIATSHHIGLHRLPTVLKAFSSRYPNVDLDIRFVDSEASYEMLSRGEVELGVITLSPETPSHVISEKIWDDPLVFMAAKDHPLAGKKNVSTKQLSEYQAVLPGSKTFTYGLVQRLFKEERLILKTAMSTNYLETLRMLASIGLAWCILPKTMLGDDLVELDVLLKEGRHPPVRQLGIICHRKRTLSNSANAFLDLVKNN